MRQTCVNGSCLATARFGSEDAAIAAGWTRLRVTVGGVDREEWLCPRCATEVPVREDVRIQRDGRIRE